MAANGDAATKCHQNDWRFPAGCKTGAAMSHFQGCACAEAAKRTAPPCRPLAKPTGVPELDELVGDWLRWDQNPCTRNQIAELANSGNVPGKENENGRGGKEERKEDDGRN